MDICHWSLNFKFLQYLLATGFIFEAVTNQNKHHLILPDECAEIIYYDAKLFSGRRATRPLYLLSKRAKGSRLASAKNDGPRPLQPTQTPTWGENQKTKVGLFQLSLDKEL